MFNKSVLSVLLFFLSNIISFRAHGQQFIPAFQSDEYMQMKSCMLNGWGAFNTRDVLTHILLPDGAGISMDFYWESRNTSGYLEELLFHTSKDTVNANAIPIAYAWDGSYSCLKLEWGKIKVLIETATEGQDLVALLTPFSIIDSTYAIIEAGIFWNREGQITKEKQNLKIITPNKSITVFPAGTIICKFNVATSGPYFSLCLSQKAGLSTGRHRSLEEITELISSRKNIYHLNSAKYGKLAPVWEAITTVVNWNTTYDPIKDRIFTSVSRNWNVGRGGYAFFGWDNFFMAFLSSLGSKELAFANVIELLHEKTPQGSIPCNSQGNGRKTWDKSQPPVGSLMVWEIYKQYPERWFLEAVFNELLLANQWWMERRFYKGMLCWGSDQEKNPYNDPHYYNLAGAVIESGMDDSPMYLNVEFNKDSSVMELHDVGLNSLYATDCLMLAKIAGEIGRKEEEKTLLERADYFIDALNSLWNEKSGIYQNRSTLTGDFMDRISPTVFYPLLTGKIPKSKTNRMIMDYFYNTEKFRGDYIIPSVPFDDPSFPEQVYWRGTVWGPLNFIVYLGFRNNELQGPARDLAKKSGELFLKEWKRKNFVSENYSSITGTGDDKRLRSTRFYTWGSLLGIIPLMQEGFIKNQLEK